MEYLEDPVRFADLFNGTMFGGEQVIEAKYLRKEQRKKRLFLELFRQEEADTEKAQDEISQKKKVSGLKIDCMERERDIVMLYDKPGVRCLLCCEGQSTVDYNMPVRTLCYDGIEYAEQVRTQKYKRKTDEGKVLALIPVLNQVLYLGEHKWKSKYRLQEMMQIPEGLKKQKDLIPEYHVHVTDIHEQDPELFHTEWRAIFHLMKYSRKKEELKAYIEKHKGEIEKMSYESRCFLGALFDQYEMLKNGKPEVRDVCEAWDGAMLMYRDEGKKEGIKDGIKKGVRKGRMEGEKAMARRIAENMYRRGYSVEDTAGLTGTDIKNVEKWFEEFQA